MSAHASPELGERQRLPRAVAQVARRRGVIVALGRGPGQLRHGQSGEIGCVSHGPTVPGVTDVRGCRRRRRGHDLSSGARRGYLDRPVKSMSAPTAALPHSHRPGTARAALSYRDFRWIWLGLFASNIGTWMQNFTLPAYVEDRTESAALVGLLVFTQLGPLLRAVDPCRRARRPLPAPPVPRRDAGHPGVVQRAAGGLRRRRLADVDAVRLLVGDRHRQRPQCAGVPGQRAAARAPRRPRRRGQPQLGDDQRQPRARSAARGRPHRGRRVAAVAVRGQRRDLPVPDRRHPPRAHPRRPGPARRGGLAPPAHRRQHRPRPTRPRPPAADDVHLLDGVPRLRRAVPVRRPAQLRRRRRQRQLQPAVHGVGRRRLPRGAGGRHRARPHRPPPPHRRRLPAVRREPRRVRPRALCRAWRTRSRSCSASPTSSPPRR